MILISWLDLKVSVCPVSEVQLQFVDPARGSLAIQTLILEALLMLVTFVVIGLIALCASSFCKRLKISRRAQTVLNRIVGTAFAGLAIKFATTER
jgi:threonine/homoserine/homoserine lactone efflux protein